MTQIDHTVGGNTRDEWSGTKMWPYVFPGDSLALVLFLFLPQHKLNEELLQLLVAIVDTELLKADRQSDREGEGE